MGWLTDDLREGSGKQECPNCYKRAVVQDRDSGANICERCGWTDAPARKQDSWFSW